MARLEPILWSLAGIVGMLGGGCAQTPVAPGPATSLGERGPAQGVSLCWWVIDDNPYDDKLEVGEAPRTFPASTLPLAEVLSAYVDRAMPVPADVRELWRQNGLRMVSVPRRDLDRIRETLRLVGPIQQQSVGESPRWMIAARGPEWADQQALSLEDGPIQLGHGCLRMLMRCWISPALAVSSAEIAADPARRLPVGSVPGAIQIELVPQHFDSSARQGDLAAMLEPKPTTEAAGVLFSRMLLEASLSTDDALLILPERPDTQWRSSKAAPDPDIAGTPTITHGPLVPPPATLGEVMLTDLAAGARRNTRMVIVIMPSPPRTFNLLSQR